MNVRSYSDWQATADTLHMVLQMMGKAKLSKLPKQPEWKQIVLHITASGFSTGLIPDGQQAFEISVNLLAGYIKVQCSSGYSTTLPFSKGMSVANYHDQINEALRCGGHDVKITLAPQESYITDDFNQQTTAVDFDHNAVTDFFRICIAAYDAQLRFSSAFRGKKITASLFWGTYDLTTVLYSGREEPFPGKGVIEETAFDEELIEFGFWPGDPSSTEPSLFVMAYPFISRDLPVDDFRSKDVVFSKEKGEYFLPISAVFSKGVEDPVQVMADFFEDAFSVLTKEEGWANLDWLTKPLLCK